MRARSASSSVMVRSVRGVRGSSRKLVSAGSRRPAIRHSPSAVQKAGFELPRARAQAQRLRALEVVQEHRARPFEHGQAHVFLRLFAQRVQHVLGFVGDIEPRRDQRAQREEPDPQAVAAVLGVLLQKPLVQQRAGQAMNGALGHAEALGEFADAELGVFFGEGLEQVDRGRDRGQARAVTARVAVHLLARGAGGVFGHHHVPLDRTSFHLAVAQGACQRHHRRRSGPHVPSPPWSCGW